MRGSGSLRGRGPLRGRGSLRRLPGLLSRRLQSLQSLRGLFRLQLRLLRILGRLPLHLLKRAPHGRDVVTKAVAVAQAVPLHQ